MTFQNHPELLLYRKYLIEKEKSAATLEKYLRDNAAFLSWLNGRELTKSAVLAYKEFLLSGYTVVSVNSMLSSINSYFTFLNRYDLRVRTLKIQRQVFASTDRELSKAEYEHLLTAAKKRGKERLFQIIQTICSTGIRVSELPFITVEAVRRGYADICCKGKRRRVFLPVDLCRSLKLYLFERKIKKGPVFVTRTGHTVNRTNIWTEMKKLCRTAGISERKVFPHNLRHLFARTHYSRYKDIVRLADIMGHASVNTTRIYTMESGSEHRRQIQRLGLLFTNSQKELMT